VSIGGKAAQVISFSPSQVNFYIPANLQSGVVELLVTAQDRTVWQGTTYIPAVAPAMFTKNGIGIGAAAALNAATSLSGDFDVTTTANFGNDKRTRVMLFSTGISSGAANPNPNNDLRIGQSLIANLAESVAVEARTHDGHTLLLPVEYAGQQITFPGLDQIVFILTPELRGAGDVELTIIVGNQRSNSATINVR
jgi:uncharacterized protein (TIGR03437 family)